MRGTPLAVLLACDPQTRPDVDSDTDGVDGSTDNVSSDVPPDTLPEPEPCCRCTFDGTLVCVPYLDPVIR